MNTAPRPRSLRRIASELRALGHRISHTVVGELLFAQALANEQPVISVDTKKKELVGDFKNGGREWRPKGSPEEVRVHDFLIKELGRAVPYGV